MQYTEVGRVQTGRRTGGRPNGRFMDAVNEDAELAAERERKKIQRIDGGR